MKKIATRSLKTFALRHLPRSSTLKDILLSEPDELSPAEFLARIDLWLRLLEREVSNAPDF
jgi:hypothetical protein